jgi:hypothetical protein
MLNSIAIPMCHYANGTLLLNIWSSTNLVPKSSNGDGWSGRAQTALPAQQPEPTALAARFAAPPAPPAPPPRVARFPFAHGLCGCGLQRIRCTPVHNLLWISKVHHTLTCWPLLSTRCSSKTWLSSSTDGMPCWSRGRGIFSYQLR